MKWTEIGHQFDAIGKELESRKNVYIYGAGENGRYVFEKIKFLDCFQGFIDGDREKQNKGYLGKKVFSLKELKEKDRDSILVIVAVSNLNRTNVAKTLISYGFKEGKEFFDYQNFIEAYLPIYAAYGFQKLYHKGICYVPTRRCPFNCQHCLNFIPYVEKPSEDDISMVKDDLDRFFTCVDGLGILSITGGEIFLYSEYKELFRYIGKNFRDKIATLSITTSAAILPDDETFELFKKYNFTVHLSDYRKSIPGVTEKYGDFVKKLKEYDVSYVQFQSDEWLDLDVFREHDAWTEEEELIQHFDSCGIPWNFYKNGKLYACTWAGMAVMSGAKKEYMDDYYDLRNCTKEVGSGNTGNKYEFMEEKLKECMEFAFGYTKKGYVQMCAKCNGNVTINKHVVAPAVQIPRKKSIEIK